MTATVYLQGSEDVVRASHTISSAAAAMTTAAHNITYALERHERFMQDWLLDLERLLESKLNKEEKEP